MNPYQALPARSFWRTAVAEPDAADIDGLWTPKFELGPGRSDPDRRFLLRPPHRPDPAGAGDELARCRAGPAGTDRGGAGGPPVRDVLLPDRQHLHRRDAAPVAGLGRRDRDPEPPRAGSRTAGTSTRSGRRWSRTATRTPRRCWPPASGPWPPSGRAVGEASCLIFTLGLTEAWHERGTGVVYPVCPGTVRGSFDERPARVRQPRLRAGAERTCWPSLALAHGLNPGLRLLLTVSPVPLTATATGRHALTATTYSKSVLRAVAGQLAAEHEAHRLLPGLRADHRRAVPGRLLRAEPARRDARGRAVRDEPVHRRARLPGGRARSRPAGRTLREPGKGADQFCDDAVLDYYNAG